MGLGRICDFQFLYNFRDRRQKERDGGWGGGGLGDLLYNVCVKDSALKTRQQHLISNLYLLSSHTHARTHARSHARTKTHTHTHSQCNKILAEVC